MTLLDWIAPKSCLLCGREGEVLCKACIPAATWRQHESGVWCAWEFTQVRKLLHALKYQGIRGVSQLLCAGLEPPADIRACVGVPTPVLRRWIRGYSQAEVLAEDLAGAWGCLYQPVLRVRSHRSKVRQNRAQRTLDGGRFVVATPPSQPVWLVDDVVTTGATLRACEEALTSAGAVVAGKLALAGVL